MSTPSVPLHLLPENRLSELEAHIENLQLQVESLRYRGRLHPKCKILEELLESRVRYVALARLSNNASEIEAELDLGRCYGEMKFWTHATAHAKKAVKLAKDAIDKGQNVDKILQGRILCLLGESIAQSPLSPKVSSAYSHPAISRRVLARAAKFTGVLIQDIEGKSTTPEDDGNMYSDDGFEDSQDNSADLISSFTESGLKKPLLQTAQAEVCEAMAVASQKVAISTRKKLRLDSKEAALEWLVGKEGQKRLKERTNDFVARQLERKTGEGGASRQPGKNTALIKEEASRQSRHQLIKEATADAMDRFLDEGRESSYKYYQLAISWLTQAWELREASCGHQHAETAMSYERLGIAHAKAASCAYNKSVEGKREHYSQAVRFFTTARSIFEELDDVGPGSAACARVSYALRDVYKSIGDHECAGQQATLVASFYEREANRGRRCLEGSSTDEGQLAILMLSKSSSDGNVLAIPAAVGIQAAAEHARDLFKLSVSDFSTALKKISDSEAEIRIGMSCMQSAKSSVSVSAYYFGQESMYVAEDLMHLGSLCATHGWDFQLAKDALSRACQLFRLHGARKLYAQGQSKLSSLQKELDAVND